MIIFSMFSWWYSAGWQKFGGILVDKLRGVLSFFSIGALLRTLFAPFRQISATSDDDSPALDARFRAFTDQLVSRLVGGVIRLFLMIVGLIAFVIWGALSLILFVSWPLVPAMPIVCIVLTVLGVAL